MYSEIITWLIVIFGTVNIIRIGFFMIGSDIYSVLEARRKTKLLNIDWELPKFTVVIPAHNEESTITYCLKSVIDTTYPVDKLEIIVADDGSTDTTIDLINKFKQDNPQSNIQVFTQPNAGKAHALNNAMKNMATGELVMCLDADSSLDANALQAAAGYFQDERVVAMAANVKIRSTNSLFNLIQQYEYIICYQMKRALTVFNIEYIIGGIGSVFRTSKLAEVGYYDTNTMTEDIDLSMKFLQKGGKNWRVVYGANVIAYTESVLDVAGLIRQRYRWKYGRSQTFFKHKNLFFNSGKEHNRFLTWFYLPFAIYSDLAFFLEPLLVSYIFYIIIRYHDWITLLSATLVVGGYITFNVLVEQTIPWKKRLTLTLLAPSMYMFFYLLSFVEYVALIKGIIDLPKVKKSLAEGTGTWQHVDRPKTI